MSTILLVTIDAYKKGNITKETYIELLTKFSADVHHELMYIDDLLKDLKECDK